MLAELKEAVDTGMEFEKFVDRETLRDIIALECYKVVLTSDKPKEAGRSASSRRKNSCNGHNQLSLTEIAGGLSGGQG